MKIVLVIHGYPFNQMGGAGLLVQHLSRQLALRGHDVHVLVPQSSPIKTAIYQQKKEWGHLHILHTQYLQWADSWEQSRAGSLLKTWLMELQPDICHIHHLSGLPLHFQRLLPSTTKLVITLHDYAIPCARGQLYHREHRQCSSNHIDNCERCLQPFRASRASIIRRLGEARMLLSSADVLLSPSLDLAKRMRALYPELHISQISLPLFEKMENCANKDADFIFVGSIIPPKGLDLFLKALLRFPRNHPPSAKIIGFSAQYPTWRNYQQYCQKLAALSPSIHWLGEQSHADCINHMRRVKCLVLPSLWPENSPLTIREATALGLPVICSSWGGAAELLIDRSFVLQEPSVHQLYQLLKRARNQPQGIAQSWPTPEMYCEQLLAIYQ